MKGDKRIRLFFRELGMADAVARLPHRSADALRLALHDALDRYAPGGLLEAFVPAMNAYPPAYRRGQRGATFFEYHDGAVLCALCTRTVPAAPGPLAAHVLGVVHLGMAAHHAARPRTAAAAGKATSANLP